MNLELELTSQKIMDKEFPGKKPGYDPLEVDEFLDIVIKDYVKMEQYITDVNKAVTELQKTCKIYNKDYHNARFALPNYLKELL